MSDFTDSLNKQTKGSEFKAEWNATDSGLAETEAFYSAQNQARLRKSIAEMEATGGTVHEIDYTDSLTGILRDDSNIDNAKSERLTEKYK